MAGRVVGSVAPTGQIVVYRILVLVMMTSVVRLAGQWRTVSAQDVSVTISVV